jgi:hypothetical protein
VNAAMKLQFSQKPGKSADNLSDSWLINRSSAIKERHFYYEKKGFYVTASEKGKMKLNRKRFLSYSYCQSSLFHFIYSFLHLYSLYTLSNNFKCVLHELKIFRHPNQKCHMHPALPFMSVPEMRLYFNELT